MDSMFASVYSAEIEDRHKGRERIVRLQTVDVRQWQPITVYTPRGAEKVTVGQNGPVGGKM